jgi:choline dehydrogenase
VSLVRPHSRGEVRLRSADPLAAPIIRGNYLQEANDVAALVEGVRLSRALGHASAYGPLRGDEVEPGAGIDNRAAIIQFARRASDTIYHPAGTCRMGTGPDAVVDAQLRVRGVEGLRVADASIMPDVVNTATNATTVMIGERAAELILR